MRAAIASSNQLGFSIAEGQGQKFRNRGKAEIIREIFANRRRRRHVGAPHISANLRRCALNSGRGRILRMRWLIAGWQAPFELISDRRSRVGGAVVQQAKTVATAKRVVYD